MKPKLLQPFAQNRQVIRWTGYLLVALAIVFGHALDGFAQTKKTSSKTSKAKKTVDTTDDTPVNEENLKTATFGSGCFWCAEAVFQQLKGVKSVVSGFSGGYVKDPTYEDVCTGATGHAEVIQIKYDPDVIKFEELLEVFWKTHDPTTLNQQGPDYGTQYRSVIFYHDDTQKDLAEEYKKKLTSAKAFKAPIVTEISAFKEFYPADEHHQNFYRNHPDHPYCMTIIKHKVDKFRSVFKGKVDKTVNP